MIRVFVALPVPDMIRYALSTLQCGLPGARWIAPENFHITLRFIGEVDEGQAEDIHDNLSRIDAPGVDITLDRISWFGSKRKPSILIAQAQKNDALMHLQRKVESAVARSGLSADGRKFHPHVTLARLKTTSPADVQHYVKEQPLPGPLTFQLHRFALFSSVLTHSGSLYTEEADYLLRETVFEAAE